MTTETEALPGVSRVTSLVRIFPSASSTDFWRPSSSEVGMEKAIRPKAVAWSTDSPFGVVISSKLA